MNISIPSIVLSLGGKCLFNWSLVFLQSDHISRSFLGVFSVSLAVVDTTLTLPVAALYFFADGFVLLGWQLTRYHVCLLVQIVGAVYSALQWPVVLLAGLDHLCTVTQRVQPRTSRTRCFVYWTVTALLWYLTALYIFLLSDFLPVFEDVLHHQIHQCWVFHSPQILRIPLLLLLTLGCAVLHAGCSTQLLKNPLEEPITDASGAPPRARAVRHVASLFLNTWAPLLVLLAVLLLLPVGIPAYLGLNSAWLCFLNSLLIAAVLCVVCPASQLALGLAAVPADSFCEWRFKFSLAAEDRT